jgi:hypothetical protein
MPQDVPLIVAYGALTCAPLVGEGCDVREGTELTLEPGGWVHWSDSAGLVEDIPCVGSSWSRPPVDRRRR